MMFFIGQAAAEGGAAQQSGGWITYLPMFAFVGILYFLLIRPQQKRAKQHQALVSAVKKGDKVVTNSGIIATVSKVVNDQEVVLEIADGVFCKFVKSTIATVLDKTQIAEVSKKDNDSSSPIISGEKKTSKEKTNKED